MTFRLTIAVACIAGYVFVNRHGRHVDGSGWLLFIAILAV